MKVLMTADTLGGVWTYAAELAGALGERGVEVVVAAMGRHPSADQLELMHGTEVVACECALEWMPEPWDDVSAAGEWLLEVEDELHPDVVHVNGYSHAALAWHAGVLVTAHSDVLSWFEAVHGTSAPPEWNRYREAVERGLKHAEFVVAPTRAMLTALERHYAFEAERAVVPNGRRIAAAPVEKEPLVVGAGRAWDEAKNLDALARIAPTLPWRVLVVGEGSRTGVVAAADVEAALARASIYALPARYEPFGLSVLEAALARCALVLGDIASLRELWDGAALFVDPSDEAALRESLLELIRDGDRRSALASAARERARAYTRELMVERYLELYERVAATDVSVEPERV